MDATERRAQPDASVVASSQFLHHCDESCPAPLRCTCGVCTATCASDADCGRYAGDATCTLPDSESECAVTEPSCDVPCTHDEGCGALGGDFVCLLRRCRLRSLDAGSADREDDAGNDGSELAECVAHAPIAGLCGLVVEGGGRFGHDAPVQGTVMAIGDGEARAECFGSDQFGAAIPVAAHAGEPPVVPEGTTWLRVQAADATYVFGVAAPGFDALGVAVGDSITIRHGVSWGGHDWPFGNAHVEVEGRGRVLFAINDLLELAIEQGPVQCQRSGPCGGQEWSMLIEVDGASIEVAPFASVQVGNSRYTNARAFTHRADYEEPGESTPGGTPGCLGEPRSNFFATRVDSR